MQDPLLVPSASMVSTVMLSPKEEDIINSTDFLVLLGFAENSIDILFVLVEAKRESLGVVVRKAKLLLKQQPMNSLAG